MSVRHRAVLRAELSAAAGLGHVTRSLTLGAAMVAHGWEAVLAVTGLPEELAARARASSVGIVDLHDGAGEASDAEEIAALGADLVVADGYGLTAAFFEHLVARGVRHAVIDDGGTTPATEPLAVVNQNPQATPSLYAHLGGEPTLLLGLEHALVRREVTEHRASAPGAHARRSIFLAMGGSDPLGLTEPLAAALAQLGVPVDVAVGPATPDREARIDRLARLDSVQVIDAVEFVDRLTSSALAVLGAGTTLWEAALLGVPALAVVVAENQEAPSEAAAALGFLERFDGRADFDPGALAGRAGALLDDPATRAAMAHRGRASVDGRGADRVATALADATEGCPC